MDVPCVCDSRRCACRSWGHWRIDIWNPYTGAVSRSTPSRRGLTGIEACLSIRLPHCTTAFHGNITRSHSQPCAREVRISLVSLIFADRTNGRAYATVLRLSVVCEVMYCG